MWRRQFVYGLLFVLSVSIVAFQISIIPDQAAQVEVDYTKTVSDISNIVDNPVSFPHKIVSYGVTQIEQNVRAVRVVSIVFFSICTVALYRILKRWHSDRIALFASAMFAANATVLTIARFANPLVLLFSWAIVISLLLWVQHGNSRKFAPFMLALSSAILLYIPGAPYFFILLFILFGQKILTNVRSLSRNAFIFSIFIGLLVLAPLVYSFYQDIEVLKQWLLLPNTLDWGTIPRNILRVPSAFIYRAPEGALLGINRLPILDVAAGGLLLFGLYAYSKYKTLERTRVMLLTALFAILIGALGQVMIAVVILMPFVFAVIAAGISFILDQWFAVFPRNPFARSFGLLLVTLIVLASMYYQLTRFLVVWPQTPETREVYNQSLLIE